MKLRKICAAVLCLVLFFMTISRPVYASTFPAAEIQEATAPDITETNESDTIPKESEETSQEETDESRIETNKESQEETDESQIETNELPIQQGLVTADDGNIYYYIDGEPFTDGYKEISIDGETCYYYFQKNGQAYTHGLLEFTNAADETCYYYFQTNGQAFTAGYKPTATLAYVDPEGNIVNTSDGTTRYYYFQQNGQAYKKGLLEFSNAYGTHYFYFQANGQAYTEGYKPTATLAYVDDDGRIVNTSDGTTRYYYFQPNGQAYKKGLLEFSNDYGTHYFYFQTNGQAFTTGYKPTKTQAYVGDDEKIVSTSGDTTYYYYFQPNGQAYKKGLLEFSNDYGTHYFYFQTNGQAFTTGYKPTKTQAYVGDDGKIVSTSGDTTSYYYFRSNGQAFKGGLLNFTNDYGTHYFYFQSNGKAYTEGWKTINDNKYYFGTNGQGYKGLKTIDGTRYYFSSEAILQWVDRKYQNPSEYYQIQDSITLSGGGYNLSVGYEGLKTAYVIRKLGLGNAIGMDGAYYSNTVASEVKSFQAKNGLPETGEVDLSTWKKMGFTEDQWYILGAYASPVQVTPYSTREDCIEIMIDRAFDYLGDDYIIGASGAPGEGLDCSGLVMQALFAAGIDMSPINPVRHASPGYEYESRNIWESSQLKHVSYSNRERGDLIIYCNSSGTVIHSAIYLGDDKVIESWPNKVQVSSIKDSRHPNVKGVLRVFN